MKKSLLIAAVIASLSARPSLAQSTFRDVPDNHWAAAAVKRLAEAGIIEGRPESSASNSAFGNISNTSNADLLIAPKVKTALTQNAAVANVNVNVDVTSPAKGRTGTVTLIGTVANQAQRTLATSIARHEAPGYVIINQLKVVAARSTRKR